MKLTFVGTYRLGVRYVRLFLNSDNPGGRVEIHPDDKGSPRIIIGIKSRYYEDALATLLHEAYELMLVDLRVRYTPEPMISNESSDFLFVVHHNELGRAHEEVAYFLNKALPDVSKEYKRLKRKQK